MSLTRTALRATFLRPFLTSTPRITTAPHFSTSASRYASGDYGSGAGDPKGENPQQQGSNPSADLEHPGPPPPDVGKGTGGGPTKGTSDGHNTDSNSSSGSSSGGSGSSGVEGKSSGGESKKGAQKPQPKILNESPPPEGQRGEEVENHNREMENRAEKTSPKASETSQEEVEKDKVGKEYWSGHGGADRQP